MTTTDRSRYDVVTTSLHNTTQHNTYAFTSLLLLLFARTRIRHATAAAAGISK